jgi:hypothetical protein
MSLFEFGSELIQALDNLLAIENSRFNRNIQSQKKRKEREKEGSIPNLEQMESDCTNFWGTCSCSKQLQVIESHQEKQNP